MASVVSTLCIKNQEILIYEKYFKKSAMSVWVYFLRCEDLNNMSSTMSDMNEWHTTCWFSITHISYTNCLTVKIRCMSLHTPVFICKTETV